MAVANLVLRFIVEILGIVAIAYAASQVPAGGPIRAAAGIGAALAMVATWSVLVAPTAANGLSQAHRDVAGTGLLLLAGAALAAAGQGHLAMGFGVVVAGNAALLFAFGQDARDAFSAGMAR